MWYTGVGSRNTPQYILELMTAIAIKMQFLGYVLRSGGAKGADSAFEQGASNLKEIYYARDCTPQAMEIAGRFHPAWHAMRKDGITPVVSDFARKLHGRNSFQVLGRNLDYPSNYCICWTPDGATTHMERSQRTGGTGTAISIADAYNVPVVNLAIPSEFQKWSEWAMVA